MRTSSLLCATLMLSVVGQANAASADQASLPASPHQHASPPQAAMRSSPLSVPLDAAHRSALPRESVVATVEGNDVRCEGVALAALLRAAGALPAGKLEGEALARYVLVAGREGARVLFSLAELSQEQDQRSVVLADRCGGVALDDRDGPLLLVAPGQTPSLRGMRQVQSITVVAAP